MDIKDLKHTYDEGFVPSQDYLATMPDLQNSPYIPTMSIPRVGIEGFTMPLKIGQKDGGTQEVQASITGTVSLEADKAGINMSRILRTAYKALDDTFDMDKLIDVLRAYKRDLKTFDAHITTRFKYRLWKDSLRSRKDDGTPNGGWQYYDVAFDVNLDRNNQVTKIIKLDFIYSSACPCSAALSEHAGEMRGMYAIPHSQRSVAHVQVVCNRDIVWIEDLVDNLASALSTETLVFCKREDEQAFAELNGAHPKFVEDAVRLVAEMLDKWTIIDDFKVVCKHLESLHSHDAIAVITKGLPNSKFNLEV